MAVRRCANNLLQRGRSFGSAASSIQVLPKDDLEGFCTPLAMRRNPSAIRALQPLTALPGMISLAGGMPNPSLFPFTGASFTFSDGAKVDIPREELNGALQYSATPGLPQLLDRVKTVQTFEHSPPNPVSVAITPGSQDGLAKLFDMFVSQGDTLLIEAPTYSGSLAYLEAIGCNLQTVETDESGLKPDHLASLLDGWDTKRQGKKPKAIYIIATGSNPTGASLSLERKKSIYAIAQKHNLVIIEDDPYYYLQFSATRTPSFLSLDVDSRVIRCDSFSKILSAGIRIGVVTGAPQFVDRLMLHNQASILHTSGLSQLAALALFRHWDVGTSVSSGLGQLEHHLSKVRNFYSSQCDAFFRSADKHLRKNADGTGDLLAEYKRPSAGMFVWMKLKGIPDTFELITKKAVDSKVRIVCTIALPHIVSASVNMANLVWFCRC
jgi:kynurenine/2-aminoadipate aminotransferase